MVKGLKQENGYGKKDTCGQKIKLTHNLCKNKSVKTRLLIMHTI